MEREEMIAKNSEYMKRYERLKTKMLTGPRREQIEKLFDYMENELYYLTAPASSRKEHHNAWEFGLMQHSVHVAENILRVYNAYKNVCPEEYSDETLILIALCHDLGKAGRPGKPVYLKNEPTPKQKAAGYGPSRPYMFIPMDPYITVPQEAVRVVSKFVDLSLEEYQAILIHDTQYVEENRPYAALECPLALLLTYADNWAGFVMEKRVL